MKGTKRIFIILASLLLIGVLLFLLLWGILNWNKVKAGMAGSGIYTQTDIQTAYEDGYNQALADKAEYEKLLVQYRELIERYEKELAQLKKPQANLALSKQCKGCKKRMLSIEQELVVQYKQPVYASLHGQGDKL